LNLKNDMTRRLAGTLLCLGLTLGLDGCIKHQPKVVTPLRPALVPVPLEDIPRPENEPVVEVPQVRMPPVPIASAAARLPREHKKPVTTKTTPPPETAAAAPAATPEQPVAETAAIGSLSTTGATSDPQVKQDVQDLIASNEKRLSALPAQKVEDQKSQISTVKNFQKQAQEALTSGDAEGAKTLATKAKLLLDDIEK
jgi:hypothetical protein